MKKLRGCTEESQWKTVQVGLKKPRNRQTWILRNLNA